MPEYHVTYPGLDIKKADMVHMRGVEPSVCYCFAMPIDTSELENGTLAFWEDGVSLIQFRDCAVRRLYSRAPGPSNNLEVEVEIVDRRARWAEHSVTGDYNLLTSSGETNDDQTKSWEELFEIVFEAMEEDFGAVDLRLPDDPVPPPAVNWMGTPCHEALRELASAAGCVVCLANDDHVIIEPRGKGPDYPFEEDARTPVVKHPVSSVVPAVEVEFAPTRYEMWIECQPVAINKTGRLSLIADADWLDDLDKFLEYNAPGAYTEYVGYGGPDRVFGVKEDDWSVKTFRRQRYMLYRMYRVHAIWNATVYNEDGTVDFMELPDGGTIRSIDQILPLFQWNLYEVGGVAYRPQDESVVGDNLSDIFDKTPPYVAYHDGVHDVMGWDDSYASAGTMGGFTEEYGFHRIDLTRGIIFFDRYMFGPSSNNSRLPLSSSVYLKATFNARDKDTGALRRYRYSEHEEDQPSRVVRYDDTYLYHVQVPYWNTLTYTNKERLDNEIGPAIAARHQSYELDTTWMEWSGLKNYSIRGNVPQMRWVVGRERVYTQGGRNLQHPFIAPTREGA